MIVSFHIDHLVVDGLDVHGDEAAIRTGMQLEFERILGSRQSALNLVARGNRDVISSDSMRLAAGAESEVVGQEIARVIYRGTQR